MLTFLGVGPGGALDARARARLDAAHRVFAHRELGIARAEDVPSIDELVAAARSNDVVRILVASNVFDDEAVREMQLAIEAPIDVEILAVRGAELPLAGRRVLVTRASEQAEGTARALRRRGAIPVLAPTIVIGPPSDPAPLARAVRALASYDLVAFTSANGVEAFFRALDDATLDARALGGALVAAIGPGTAAALVRHGVRADVVADEHRGEALADAIVARVPSGARVLLPRAAVARNALPDALARASIHVDVVEAYRTRRPTQDAIEGHRARLLRAPVDAVTFTASSTVESFVESFTDAHALLRDVVVASIGPITSEACRARGLRVDVEASPYTIPALVDALERFFSGR